MLNMRTLGLKLGVAMALGVYASTSAWALSDLLDLPAMMAPKAAKALTLGVAARAGTVLMVGERGIVLQRNTVSATPAQGVVDAEGVAWKQARVPVSVNLTSVCFASDKVVFAVGHDGVVLKSMDAGANWVRVFDGNQANAQVVALAQKRLSEVQTQEGEQLDNAQFALEDAQAGAKFGPSRPLLDVWFKDEKNGWVVGSYGQVFETHDGGAQWTLIADRLDNPDARHYNGVYSNAQGQLLIAGEAGRVYLSNDFGTTWQRMDTGYTGHLYGARVVRTASGQSVLYAYGFGGSVYRKKADSPEWQRLNNPSRESLVYGMVDGETVWFVDQKGRVLKTDNSMNQLTVVHDYEGKTVTGAAWMGNAWVFSGQGGPRTLKMSR
jgi:photosystem II stability/assembly factor-like uncharacterized protein